MNRPPSLKQKMLESFLTLSHVTGNILCEIESFPIENFYLK